MDTVKISEKKNTRFIAHQGLSALEQGNTVAAFVAAGNRSYFGTETDVHVTADGKYVVIHDSNTERVSGVNMCVEEENFDKIREIYLYDTDGQKRSDLRIPSLEEYIRVCKKYGKRAVLELKNPMQKETIADICRIIKEIGYFEGTIFISFEFENLVALRELYSDAEIQFLTGGWEEELPEKLKAYNMHLDIEFSGVTKEMVDECHAAGVLMNCWTVDDPEDAKRLIDMGVDFITTNILE